MTLFLWYLLLHILISVDLLLIIILCDKGRGIYTLDIQGFLISINILLLIKS
jgi:hypothetical protein